VREQEECAQTGGLGRLQRAFTMTPIVKNTSIFATFDKVQAHHSSAFHI